MSESSPQLSLSGQAAIITGASTGIGAAIAAAYADAGAGVVINYAPDTAKPEEILANITSRGGKAVAVQADVRDLSQHALIIDAAVSNFGRLDILVNNAGVLSKTPFLEVTEEIWDLVSQVNVKGPYFLAQAAAKVMIKAGTKGRIINVTSTHEARALGGCSVYSISKSGLGMVTQSLALELARHNITVNSLIPGAFHTPMNSEPYADPVRKAKAIAKVPLGRVGLPQDLVGAALFLVSTSSEYMTGTGIKIDGGISI